MTLHVAIVYFHLTRWITFFVLILGLVSEFYYSGDHLDFQLDLATSEASPRIPEQAFGDGLVYRRYKVDPASVEFLHGCVREGMRKFFSGCEISFGN